MSDAQYIMNFLLILFAGLAHLAACGSVTLSGGLTVAWTVTAPSITFTLTASSSLASSYSYWGIGFKSAGSKKDMKSSELWILTKSGTFATYWSTSDSDPTGERSGTAVMKSFVSSNGGYVAVITRNLSTGNSYDVQLQQGSSYVLTYAYGSMSGSRWQTHTADGGTTITIEASTSGSGTTGSGTSTTGSGTTGSGTSTTGSTGTTGSGTSTTGSTGTTGSGTTTTGSTGTTGSSTTTTTGSTGTTGTSTTSGTTDSGFETSESAPSTSAASHLLYLTWLALGY